MPPALTLQVDDAEALRALIEKDLSKRRAFVPGASGVEPRTPCDLVVAYAGRTLTLAGEVVFVRAEDPGRGVGLALAPLDADGLASLRAFPDPPSDGAGLEGLDEGERDDDPVDAEGEELDASSGAKRGAPLRLHERLVAMSGTEQLRLAATGSLPERIALERMYGPTVWPVLLENARITTPEVARIARKGTLPRPLVEMIAGNASWLAVGEVQRALLSNPRSPTAVIEKVLRALSRRDLQRVPTQTAYTTAVRAAAKRMLGG